MNGFGLLLGHLVGDYLFQTDWMAACKTLPHPGPRPVFQEIPLTSDPEEFNRQTRAFSLWEDRLFEYRIGHLACLVHCLLYTLAVWLCSFWFLPWWAYPVVFLAHFPVDRWRLARVLMRWTWHEGFATGPLSPWSIILTDNIVHLLVLFVLGLLAGVP
jgi:hypothetical protein